MDLPIKFPTQQEVIDEEVARFRALTPEERMAWIYGLFETGATLMRCSTNPEGLRECARHHEETSRRNILEFVARHAG